MFFQQDALNLQILDVFKIIRKSMTFGTTKRNFHVLSQRISGNAKIFYQGEVSLHEGDVLYLPSKIRYSQTTDGETLIAVHLNVSGSDEKKINVLTPQNRIGSADAFERIYEAWRVNKCGSRYRALAILYQLLSDLHAQSVHAVQPKDFATIKGAVQYLESQYSDPSLTIEQAASHSNISAVYFRRLFKNSYGISPLKYLISLRIQNAKRLLASGYYRVCEVAAMTGFSDVKYFSAVFKKETGKTPSEYSKYVF